MIQALREEGLTPGSAAQLLLALARYGTPTGSAILLAEVICPAEQPAESTDEESSGGDLKILSRGELETLINAVWALGVLEHAQAPVTKRIAAQVAEALSASMAAAAAAAGGAAAARAARPPPDRLLRKVYHAQMLLRHGGGELPLTEDVASSAAAAWAVALWPDETAGRVQSRFTRFLDAMEVPYAANVPAADGRLRIDVLLRRDLDQVRFSLSLCGHISLLFI